MNFITQRLRVIGYLFLACSLPFTFLIGYLAQLYVSAYLTKPYGLTLLGNDLCTFTIVPAILAELVIVGLTCLLVSALLKAAGWLRLRFSN